MINEPEISMNLNHLPYDEEKEIRLWDQRGTEALEYNIKLIQDTLCVANATTAEIFHTSKKSIYGEFPMININISQLKSGLKDTRSGQQLIAKFQVTDIDFSVCDYNFLVKKNTVYLFGRFIHGIETPQSVLNSLLDPGFYILPMEMYDSVLEILTKNYYEHI